MALDVPATRTHIDRSPACKLVPRMPACCVGTRTIKVTAPLAALTEVRSAILRVPTILTGLMELGSAAGSHLHTSQGCLLSQRAGRCERSGHCRLALAQGGIGNNDRRVGSGCRQSTASAGRSARRPSANACLAARVRRAV